MVASDIKTLDYYLERNFHISYYLVAGTTAEERQHLHLLDKTQYHYLGQRGAVPTRQNGVRDDDATRFEQLSSLLIAVVTLIPLLCAIPTFISVIAEFLGVQLGQPLIVQGQCY